MLLTIEFDLLAINTPDQCVEEALQYHFDETIKQIKRYPNSYKNCNVGYVCGPQSENGDADIEARWSITDALMGAKASETLTFRCNRCETLASLARKGGICERCEHALCARCANWIGNICEACARSIGVQNEDDYRAWHEVNTKLGDYAKMWRQLKAKVSGWHKEATVVDVSAVNTIREEMDKMEEQR